MMAVFADFIMLAAMVLVLLMMPGFMAMLFDTTYPCFPHVQVHMQASGL